MLRPFDPNGSELMKLDRIMADSGTGLLWLFTFAAVCAVFLAVQAATAVPKFLARSTAEVVHGLRHPA